MTKWDAFANERLYPMRDMAPNVPGFENLPDRRFDPRWQPIEGKIISEMLPKYKFFSNVDALFALDSSGKIYLLSWDNPQSPVNFREIPELVKTDPGQFLVNQRLFVNSPEAAVKLYCLIRTLTSHGYFNDATWENHLEKFEPIAEFAGDEWCLYDRYRTPEDGAGLFIEGRICFRVDSMGLLISYEKRPPRTF